MYPILDTILEVVPKPATEIDKPLKFQPALIDYNDYVGRMGIGKYIKERCE